MHGFIKPLTKNLQFNKGSFNRTPKATNPSPSTL